MGLIKTAILGGVAAYGVHEISKASQTHHANQNQRYNSSTPYNNNFLDEPPPRPRDAYNPAFQGHSQRTFQDTHSDARLVAHPEDSDLACNSERRMVNGKEQRSASCGAADYGSSQEHYRASGQDATYQPRPYDDEPGYADYSSPPPYDPREQTSAGPRRQGGFVEGDLFERGPRGQQRQQNAGLSGTSFVEMLGSQLGKGGLFDQLQGRDGKKGGREGRRGDDGLGRLGSLLVGTPRR